jgi:hypothetical protein
MLLILYFGFGVIRHAHFSRPQEFGEIVPPDINLYMGSLIVEKAGDSKHEGVRRSNDINKISQLLNYYRKLKLSRTLSRDYDKSIYYDISLPVKQGPNISVRFFRDGYLWIEKGGEINYYRILDEKIDLDYMDRMFDSMEKTGTTVQRKLEFPMPLELTGVQGMETDLNGDGILEQIFLYCDEYGDLFRLRINNLSITSYGSHIDKKIELVDIDKNDTEKEIAIPESGRDGKCAVSFYRYTSDNIIFIGKIEGSLYNGEIVIKGDGTVQSKTKEKYKLQTHHLSGGLLLASGAPEMEKNTVPNETQVKSAYQQAVEAYGWFDMTTMPTDDSDSKDYNGTAYYRVKHDTIKTYADLKNHLQNLFTDDIVNQLLSQSDASMHYMDIDGALYAIQADRGTDIYKGDETHQIIYENDKKIIYRVEVEVIDPDTQKAVGKETHDFIYENLNGKWVFSKFYLVR